MSHGSITAPVTRQKNKWLLTDRKDSKTRMTIKKFLSDKITDMK